MKDKLLIVDDCNTVRDFLKDILEDNYDIYQADNGESALELLENCTDLPYTILLDVMMPGMDGFEVLQSIKENPKTKDIPVLLISEEDSEVKALNEGAIDFIQKPFNNEVIKARINNYVQLYRHQVYLNQMVDEKANEFLSIHEKMLETLAAIIEYRSLESGGHIKRVRELTQVLVLRMLEEPMFSEELNSSDYMSIIKASSFHDIGKISVPDNVLLKPGRLTREEFEIIKNHSIAGSEIIDSIKAKGNETYLRHCRDICRHHHERWDGTGYPDKLKGTDIPLSARIVAIVDVYDALVSRRIYRPEFPLEEAYAILKSGSGTQFQPEIVNILLEVHWQLEKVQKETNDSDI